MRKSRRLITIAFSILFALFLVFALSFVAVQANHTCIGESCRICQEILFCTNLLRLTSAAFIFVFAAAALGNFIKALRHFVFHKKINFDLVSLKVKLSD